MSRLAVFLWVQTTDPEVRYFTLKDPNPEPSLSWVILNAFFFIGVVLLVAMCIGIAFGGFRFWLLTKFPNNKFNGADEEDLSKTFRLND